MWISRAAVERLKIDEEGEFPLSWRYKVEFDDWSVNPRFSEDDFRVKFTPGVLVHDRFAGTSYHAAGGE